MVKILYQVSSSEPAQHHQNELDDLPSAISGETATAYRLQMRVD